MPVALITLGVLAQSYAAHVADTGSLHTWGVVSVICGVVGLILYALIFLAKALD